MKDLRNQINEIDQQIVTLLGKRMGLVNEVGKVKKSSGASVTDEKRENEIRDQLKILAQKHDLDPEFVNHLYTHIFIESRKIQG